MRLLLRLLSCAVSLVLAAGCVTSARVSPELSEQIRQMAEWRDTCTQYAAWVARDYRTNAVVMQETQRLYIKASAAANGYIEALEFDVVAGAPVSPERFAGAAESVKTNTANFLTYVQNLTESQSKDPKSRGGPFLLALPLLVGLVDLGMKLNDAAKAANQRQREMVVKALNDKKWKAFRELSE